MSDIVVIGAGVVGGLTALELAARGCKVTVIDAGSERLPASWAGGGILSPLFPWRYPDSILPLTRSAASRYGMWREQILSVGGRDPELLAGGMLLLGRDINEALIGRWQQRSGFSAQCVTAGDFHEWLGARSAVWMPDVHRLRNPRFLDGMRALMVARGIRLVSAVVVNVSSNGKGASVLTVNGDRFPAQYVVIAAGAWGQRLLPAALSQALFPVRGQMLMYRPRVPCFPHVLLSETGYLIPRADGALLAGSTLESGISDSIPTSEAFASLHSMAVALWPALAEEQPVAQWAGIRPGSPRRVPWIGPLPGTDNSIWINSGHFRNGLVCAPASAELLAQLVCEETPFCDVTPYAVSVSSSSSSP